MTLAELDVRIQKEEVLRGGDVYLSPKEWMELAPYIPAVQFVQASCDEPAFFWFNARRVKMQLR